MRAACDAFDRAYRAGADKDTLARLRRAHQDARTEWYRARAAAGDTHAAVMLAIGAAQWHAEH